MRIIRMFLEMASKPCPNGCGHERRQHSRNGCTEPGCPCTATYMDF